MYSWEGPDRKEEHHSRPVTGGGPRRPENWVALGGMPCARGCRISDTPLGPWGRSAPERAGGLTTLADLFDLFQSLGRDSVAMGPQTAVPGRRAPV